jgi:hypothetical protein
MARDSSIASTSLVSRMHKLVVVCGLVSSMGVLGESSASASDEVDGGALAFFTVGVGTEWY